MPVLADSAPVIAWTGSLPLPAPPPPPPPICSAENDLWSTDNSAELYKINGWGAPYFSINGSGNISVLPFGAHTLPHQNIDLMKVINKAQSPKSIGGLGLQLPILVRFPDILKNRLESLQSSFDSAIRSNGYNSLYQGVYPVKCNQDRYIVEDIVEFGSPFRFGLEAGSKPELLLAMSCLTRGGHVDAFLICNGYKDEEYIALALTARALGLDTVIVLEQEEELDTVIDASRKLGIRPVIGMRAKLRTKHSGHFGSTSGEKGKFGLNPIQIISVVNKLKKYEMLDCLQLLHFHIGSQIQTTELLSDGVTEAAHIYCELVRMGAPMRVIDIGGGLGIDYDGSKSGGSDMSVEYGLDEYASAVVTAVKNACNRKNLKHPIICSESGRALVSHHSILVFEAVSVSSTASDPTPANLAYLDGLPDDSRSDYRNVIASVVRGDYVSCGFYADRMKKRCVEQFKDGTIGLEHLAAVDRLCDLASREIGVADSVTTYHVNMSVFTSVPDYWAIGQMFPVVPIHRLNEKPGLSGVLSDLTCDSDGKIDKFIGGKNSLPLHEIKKGGGEGGYYLGMFLAGAYQEALGGLHNLFGGPSVVRVVQSEGPHCFAVTRAAAGPSVADVLRTMQHEPEMMKEVLEVRAEEYGVAGACRRIGKVFDEMPYLISRPVVPVGDSDGVEWE